MILASHIVIGAAVGRMFPASPALGFLAGLMSHYAMDAIPHWEYALPSIFERKKNGAGRVRISEVAVAGIDCAAGIMLALAIFPSSIDRPEFLSLTLGMLGGILPDGLQFLHFFYAGEPLRTHQKFHDAIHANRRLADQPLLGIPLQIAIVAAFILISNFFAPR